jgi:hypothetical protein
LNIKKLPKIPKTAKKGWFWYIKNEKNEFSTGSYVLIVQTYINLKPYLKCELVNHIPKKGIILVHKDDLDFNLKPNKNQFFVSIKGDKAPHPYAQYHITQNSTDKSKNGKYGYICHWPQPALIPRNKQRKDIENIAFFGPSQNIDKLIKKNILSNMRLKIIPMEKWHDYSKVDAIIAVRKLGSKNKWNHKPASKLINAWRAGVPAILGNESAFRSIRKNKLDYIEVNSLNEIIINLLKHDDKLRNRMIKNGLTRAKEFIPEKITKDWIKLIKKQIFPLYLKWKKQNRLSYEIYLLKCWLRIKYELIKTKISRKLGIYETESRFGLFSQ